MSERKKRKPVRGAESGAVAVEFAILGPVFILVMAGILVWGQFLWVAHTVQQLANDSARAALAGLDPAERESLARATLTAEVADYANLRPSSAVMKVENTPDRITVSVSYDTTSIAIQAFSGLLPSPPKQVVKQATVRLGGY